MKLPGHPIYCFSIIFCLLTAGYASAQQGPRTIPGLFKGDIWDEDFKVMQVTPDGSKVAFEQFLKFHTLLLKEGKFVSVKPKWTGRLSPDHTYSYTNQPGIDDGRSNSGSYQTGPHTVALQYGAVLARPEDDNPVKVFVDTNFIVGMNAKNQLIVSTAWTKNSGRIKGLKGLRLLDPKTFQELKVLRTDTILHTVPDIYLPRIWFNSTHTALLRQKVANGPTLIYPFSSDSVIECAAVTNMRDREPMSDDHYLYEVKKNSVNVFSIHSGKLLFSAGASPHAADSSYVFGRCLYALAGSGRLYRYDQEQKAVYEEQVSDAGLRTVKTYPLHAANETFLSKGQAYYMAAVAGPSVMLVPRFRVDGNVPQNEGYVLHLPSGKLSLRIAPFFNPDTAQLAHEAKIRADNAAWPKRQCELKLKALGVPIGGSVESGAMAGILRSYDCDKDYITLWVPTYLQKSNYDTSVKVDGATFRTNWKLSKQKWVDCLECKGGGFLHYDVTRETKQEVAQGYFSGVKTTVTKTWTEKGGRMCETCHGTGKVRK